MEQARGPARGGHRTRLRHVDGEVARLRRDHRPLGALPGVGHDDGGARRGDQPDQDLGHPARQRPQPGRRREDADHLAGRLRGPGRAEHRQRLLPRRVPAVRRLGPRPEPRGPLPDDGAVDGGGLPAVERAVGHDAHALLRPGRLPVPPASGAPADPDQRGQVRGRAPLPGPLRRRGLPRGGEPGGDAGAVRGRPLPCEGARQGLQDLLDAHRRAGRDRRAGGGQGQGVGQGSRPRGAHGDAHGLGRVGEPGPRVGGGRGRRGGLPDRVRRGLRGHRHRAHRVHRARGRPGRAHADLPRIRRGHAAVRRDRAARAARPRRGGRVLTPPRGPVSSRGRRARRR
ncbi:hypothetical protein SBRY_120097 [Actinacidiphila bryophytorum]|uniref:Uncharacterized protein n=1 Tax=Actinacidiphila bryophytorum TaxID=1436133 RepID=A0A9W4GYW4_9ACTN|nr:hypothetical protein SBRY_120097 [Actinacidiphila bryophytorum]